ncbi:hypothetical protein N7492_006167 [Penicillium capsulatum]|uniref:FAR1 domain-containing protein n=1 Tax=Penicillium capsulatum TaxID=69766 RepID=A0A9W9I2E6_9EURO|nr:hypothetical protein N7492_006167 [Penicillium capsulatum]KAJ6108818.1 hypothetical protein N7512_008655 [Penicillium capsulatum]
MAGTSAALSAAALALAGPNSGLDTGSASAPELHAADPDSGPAGVPELHAAGPDAGSASAPVLQAESAAAGAESAESTGLQPPPTDAVFATRDECVAFIRRWGMNHGYVPTIWKSNANRQIYMRCDRSGVFNDQSSAAQGPKRRRTSTRRDGCPFLVYASIKKNSSWRIQVREPCHNHPADTNLIAHPMARRFTPDQLKLIQSLDAARAPPAAILTALRHLAPDHPIVQRDVYNALAEIRRSAKLGKEKQNV